MEKGFVVLWSDRFWKCHPVVESYCCDMPESTDMIGVKHGRTSHPCALCMSTWDDIYELKLVIIRHWKSMETVYNQADRLQKEYECLLKSWDRKKAREAKARMMNRLNAYSLNSQKCVISKVKLTNESCFNDPYFIFTVKPLHLPHLDRCKTNKECTAVFLSWTEKKYLFWLSDGKLEKQIF